MNKNIIQFIVDENGQYISIPVGRVKAKSNLTTRIQLVTPITASVAVNYLIYDSKNINKKQYLIPTGDLGSAVVDPNNPNYQLVAGWKVYEADIYAPILSVISKYRTGKVGISFEFVEQVPNALCTNFVDYFGFTKELPEIANNGDYFICEDYNFWLNDKLYNKGDILVWYNEQWNNGDILPKALTETVDISVDPAISYPTEEVDETAFGNAIGELAEDVAELDTRLNGVETDLNGKQDKVDLGLNTTNKAVVGGINELKTQEELHYNALNTNKLDKNFNLLVERTFAQLTDWVAVRSGSDTLKMSLETLRTYLTQGLVGLSFVIVEELPPTGVLGVIYLLPTVANIEHYDSLAEFPVVGVADTMYIADDTGNRYQWNATLEEYETYTLGYEEYIWLEETSAYELIGSTAIDLTGYATETWVTNNFVTQTAFNVLDGEVVKSISVNGGSPTTPIGGNVDLEIDTLKVDGISYLRDPSKTYLVVKIPTDNDEFTLLTGTAGSPNYAIEWGDGSSENVTTTDNVTHVYEKAGMYLITISGNFANGIMVGSATNPNKAKYIEVYLGTNHPSSYPLIGEYAFSGCTNLEVAHIPNITTPNIYMFQGCTKLRDIYAPKITNLASSFAENNISLREIYIPNVTNATFAFSGCTNLELVYAPKLTNISIHTFRNCSKLKNLTIGNITTTSADSAFSSVVLDTLTISGNVSDTDITRIRNLITTGGGTFSQSCEIKYGLQVEKIPTLDNDVVRKIDLDDVKNLIPTQVNRYFTEATQTLFAKSFYTMQSDKPTDPIANIDTTITATSQETAQVLARFTTADGLSSEISLPPQNTEVNIEAVRTAGTRNVRIFARGYIMDDAGNETLLSTSNVATLTDASVNHILLLPIPAYTAPVGSRVIIEILSYRVSGSGTHTARIRVNNDTMSKWSYNRSLADLNLDAKNITYNNTTSGLTATNVQEAVDEIKQELDNASGLTLSDNLDTPSSSVGLSTLGAYNELKLYDIVIKTQAEFDDLLASPSWFGANSVAFVGNGGSSSFKLSTPNNQGVRIGGFTKEIAGFNNAIIEVENFKYDNTLENAALWYEIKPTTTDYSIKNLTIKCSSNTEDTNRCYAVQKCINLYNVYAYAYKANETSIPTAYGFRNCDNLVNCYSYANSYRSGFNSNGVAYSSCNNLINCKGKVEYVSGSDTRIFNLCSQLVNCYAENPLGTIAFYNCSYGSNNRCFDTTSSTGGTMTKWSTETND
jgi:hypothetical protein